MTPNDDAPDRRRWSSATAGGLKPEEIGTFTAPLIRETDTVASIGTPLATRIIPALRARKFGLLRGEQRHPALANIPPEAEEYERFGAGYGEVWSARELLQLIRRCTRRFAPKEDRRHEGDIVVDVFRPRLRYPARSDREFDLLLDRHLNAVRSAFRRSSVLIVALAASEVRESIVDGAVLPGPPADGFDAERHAIRTLTVEETVTDLESAILELRSINPGIRVILMVSPEPLGETAAPVHVLAADAYGKAILRVAMEQTARLPGVAYFPAMEILAMRGAAAFDKSGRTLSSKAVGAVTAAMLAASEGGEIAMTLEKDSPEAFAAFAAKIPVESPDAEAREAREAVKAERREKRAADKQEAARLAKEAEAAELVKADRRKKRAAEKREAPLATNGADADELAKADRREKRVAAKRAGKKAEKAAAAAAAAAKPEPRPPAAPVDEFADLARISQRKERKARRALADDQTKPPRPRREKPQGTLAERLAEKKRRLQEAKSAN